MNVRLDPRSVRFRLGNKELAQLQNDGLLTQRTLLGDGCLITYGVCVDEKLQNTTLALQKSTEKGLALMLHVASTGIHTLATTVPSREGLQQDIVMENGETVALMLEVDVRRAKSTT